MPRLTVTYPVPYTCQFASPEYVRDFIHGGRSLEDDPRWVDYGATSPAEYAHWARRSCGVVCIKMAVEALLGEPPSTVMDWVQAGLAIDGYLTRLRADRPNERVELGWKHDALVQLAADRGLDAARTEGLTLANVSAHIRADRLLVASVSSELGEDGPVTRRSGHLVLVHGVEVDEAGEPLAVIVHNPSGRTAPYQAAACIPVGRFGQGFSGRAILIGRRRKTGTVLPPE